MGNMNGGGVEAVVMNCYRKLDRADIQFDFVVCEGSSMVPVDEIRALGGRVFYVPPYTRIAAFQSSLYELFCSEQWSIVHSHLNTLSLFPLRAAYRAGVPVRIAHSHSAAGKGEVLKNMLKLILRTQANRYPTHRLSCSSTAGNWLFGNNVKFSVIPNAIEINHFAYDFDKRKRIREAWGVGEKELVIGNVGRLCKQKNQIFLVDVLSMCRKMGLPAKLVVVGEGKEKKNILQRARKRGMVEHVILPGFSESAEVYSGFDVFAFPSRYEGLGMAVIEAQISGLPCLISQHVPSEARVTRSCVKMLSLDSKKWAQMIKELCAAQIRDTVHCAELDKFDDITVAQGLKEYYEELQHEAQCTIGK